MATTFIGTTFPATSLWYQDEIRVIDSIRTQINSRFLHHNNLLINTTWFGPQFNNGQYKKFLALVNQKQTFDNVFLIAAADPVFLNQEQIAAIQTLVQAKQLYLLGHFDSQYYFNFHAAILASHFQQYDLAQITLQDPALIFVNYNRKPRTHRIQFVELLKAHGLDTAGIVTLGNDIDNIYSGGLAVTASTLNELTAANVQDSMGAGGNNQKFGIPDDIHSLGNIEIWQQHFLNIVGETEFLPWDNMFISEKTWKPILGLRPFVINGQTKIYQYLRDQGFRTFNHHWPHIDLEGINELEVHNSIVQVIKYLQALGTQQLQSMYEQMLPDLLHNRQHFAEFSQTQRRRIANLFV